MILSPLTIPWVLFATVGGARSWLIDEIEAKAKETSGILEKEGDDTKLDKELRVREKETKSSDEWRTDDSLTN